MIDLSAAYVSPWDSLQFAPRYYGLLLILTACLVIANIAFFTVVYGDGAFWMRVKLAVWRTAGAVGGLGLSAVYGKYTLLRISDLLARAAH
jgi:hypothetical protein